MPCKTSYTILPTISVHPASILKYWTALADVYPFLNDRFCDLHHPTIQDAMYYTYQHQYQQFFIFPPSASTPIPVAEFTLTNHYARSAHMHFSFNPYYTKPFSRMKEIADQAHELVFSTHIKTLIGITPKPNRHACQSVIKFGYKHLATIPNIAYYEGEPCDGFLTQRTADTRPDTDTDAKRL